MGPQLKKILTTCLALLIAVLAWFLLKSLLEHFVSQRCIEVAEGNSRELELTGEAITTVERVGGGTFLVLGSLPTAGSGNTPIQFGCFMDWNGDLVRFRKVRQDEPIDAEEFRTMPLPYDPAIQTENFF